MILIYRQFSIYKFPVGQPLDVDHSRVVDLTETSRHFRRELKIRGSFMTTFSVAEFINSSVLKRDLHAASCHPPEREKVPEKR